MAYAFSISSDVLPRAEVLGFRGTEAVSRPFSFQLALRVDGPVRDPAELVHEPLALEIRGPDGTQRIAGIVASATVVHVDARGALMRLELVPTLWRASLSRHSRVFTDVTIPQIVEAVLKEDQVGDVAFRLVESYPVREHVGQYKESNLAFVSRLLEREGIFYFFEHDGDRELLVIADHTSAFVSSRASSVPYRPGVEGGASYGESFFQLSMKRTALPRRVQLTDWNYRTPGVALSAEGAVSETSPGAIVRHGDHQLTPDEATRHARLRSEELRSRETVFRGSGPVSQLVSGGRFKVEDHPREAMNGELVAIAIEHVGSNPTQVDDVAWRVLRLPKDLSYRAIVTAIRSDVPFRPARLTPWPTVQGVVDGVVDGMASSPYAQIDDHGRYKVRLSFDEGDPIDGSSSTWVRMLQPHGGGAEGFHFPLRKRTEVHVAFAYGDPDRPVIVGVAHNPEKPSVVSSQNHTQNVIETGGGNRIEIEDLDGLQRIDVECPTLDSYLHLGAGAYQFEGNTEGEGWIYTGKDLEITVDGHKTEDVLVNVVETYASSQTLTIDGPVIETMSTSRTTTVDGPEINTWTGPLVETVTASVTETYNAGQETSVTGAVTLTYNVGETLTVTGGVTELYGATQDTGVTGTLDHTVTGTAAELFGATSTRSIDGDLHVVVDAPMTVVANKFDGQIASWSNLDDATKEHIEDTVVSLVGLQISLTGLALNVSLYKSSKIGVKVSFTAAQASAAGFSASYKNVKLKTNPTRDEKNAAYLRLEGANVMMKTLAVLC